jgi:hypothetical protein
MESQDTADTVYTVYEYIPCIQWKVEIGWRVEEAWRRGLYTHPRTLPVPPGPGSGKEAQAGGTRVPARAKYGGIVQSFVDGLYGPARVSACSAAKISPWKGDVEFAFTNKGKVMDGPERAGGGAVSVLSEDAPKSVKPIYEKPRAV